jgi:hypothetical protein
VIRGAKAIARGRVVIFLSLLIICLALIGAFYIPFKMDRIIKNKEIISSPSYAEELTGQLQQKLSCEGLSKDVKESRFSKEKSLGMGVCPFQ